MEIVGCDSSVSAYCVARGINAAQYGYRHLRSARVVIGRIRRFIVSSGSVCIHTTGRTAVAGTERGYCALDEYPCAHSAPDRLLMLIPRSPIDVATVLGGVLPRQLLSSMRPHLDVEDPN